MAMDMQVGFREEIDSVGLPDATEEALREFLVRLKRMAGDVRHEIAPATDRGEVTVKVFLPSLLSEAAERVAELIGDIHEEYRSARIDIYLRGLDVMRPGATEVVSGTAA